MSRQTGERLHGAKKYIRLLHCEDGPAYVDDKGNQFWYHYGIIHRGGGLPAVTKKDGSQFWYENGKYHRKNGPAVMFSSGHQEWYENGVKIK